MVVFVGSIYYGSDTDDTITGTSGNDTLYGGGGNDVITSGDGDDFLNGGGGADVIDAGAGNDLLTEGGAYSYADGAVDVMKGGLGADTFRLQIGPPGQPGNLGAIDHVYDFSSAEGDLLDLQRDSSNGNFAWMGAVANADFSFQLGQSLGVGPGAGYLGIFTWKGSSNTYLIVDVNGDGLLDSKDFALAFDNATTLSITDLIQRGDIHQVGSDGADVWSGTKVTDYYYGRGGVDTAHGGEGADELHGGAGDDKLYGDGGDDKLYGDGGGDTLYGGDGNDTLVAAGANWYNDPDGANDTNYLYGEAGNDILVGSADTYNGGKSVLDGGDGDDTLNGGARDTLLGGAGDDKLLGGLVQDGGAGADKFAIDQAYGGGVTQTITGGAGADIFSIAPSGNYAYGPRWSSYATITDFNVAEGDRVAFTYRGGSDSAGKNYPMIFRGAVDAGFSLADGKVFSSDDYGAGLVQVWTWTAGGDTYLILDSDSDSKLSNQDFVVKFKGITGLALSAFSADSLDTMYGFTTKLGGTSGADILTGTTAPETYYAVGGNDELHGGDADDYLYGGDGSDQIWGDEGNDYLNGGRGDDTIYGGDGGDRIEGGAGADTIRGGAGNDNIQAGGYGLLDQDGSDTVNIIFGDDGDDSISGGYSLKDQMHGGEGRDSLYGNGELWGDAGDDSLSTGKGAILHGGDGNDYLGSNNGGAVAVMYGDAGKDSFTGGYGDDILYVELGDSSANGGGGADLINIADIRAGEAVTLTAVVGDYGRDTFVITGALSAELTLYGGSSWSSGDYDDDLLDLSAAAGVTRVNLTLTTAQDVGMGRLILVGVDSVKAGDHGSVLLGDANVNRLIGGAIGDTLSGGGGADVLTGNGGDDVIDGGDGLDVAAYGGASTDYSWTKAADGAWTVKDLRANGVDGADTVRNVESLRFSDKSVLLSYSLPTTVATAFTAILRAPVGGEAQFAFGADLSGKIGVSLTTAGAIAEVVKAADATTSVAAMAYEFFTGKIPSLGGIDYLVSPTGPNANNLNSAYYQSFNLENRYINFAVNLGKVGEGKDAFAAKYGSLSLFDATREAYKTIFGGAPTDAKVHALIDTRVDYFASYGGDGATGIGTKAAMVGWLLAEAQKADIGVMARSTNAWLTDLADGSAPFAIDVLDPAKGYYKDYWIYYGA